ncbi:SAV_915 family protein [Amycolatopsis nigrescens]|uniref:SAV_915 family protein n=1 Tax=Amycolatopsis nigrescens TaxID=381445 RepID=UPI00146DACC3|nr:SAV_915 family protein [Amycolatopsis nigrescens]
MSVAPAVLGSEMIEDDDTPDELFTPTARAVTEDDMTLVLRELEDGGRAMLVYSSLDLLAAGCGEQQPWMGFRAHALHDLQHAAGASVVLWDPLVDPVVRQYGEYDEEGR